MAVGTPTGLANGTDTSALSVYSTASQTPTANRVVLAVVASSATSTRPDAPTLSGNGLTWVNIGTFYGSTTGTTRVRVTGFAALTGASPSAGVVTITHASSQAACSWSFAEFPGTYLTSLGDALRQVMLGESPDTHLEYEAHFRTGQVGNATWAGAYKVGTETITPFGVFDEKLLGDGGYFTAFGGASSGTTVVAGDLGSGTPPDNVTIAAGGSATYSSTQTLFGRYSFRIVSPAVTPNTFVRWEPNEARDSVTLRFYVYPVTNSSQNRMLSIQDSSGNNIIHVGTGTGSPGSVIVLDSNSSGLQTSPPTIALNAWHRFEVTVRPGTTASSGEWEVRVYSSTNLHTETVTWSESGTGADLNGDVVAGIDWLRLGTVGVSNEQYFAGFGWAWGFEKWIGPHPVITEIHEVAQTGPNAQIQSEYALGPMRRLGGYWTGTSREAGVIGVELRAADNPIDLHPSDLLRPKNRGRVFKTAPISINTAADNLIFTVGESKAAYIYGIFLVSEGTVTVMMESPTTDVAPVTLQAGEGYKLWVDPPASHFHPLREATFEINLDSAVQVDGWVAYWEEDL